MKTVLDVSCVCVCFLLVKRRSAATAEKNTNTKCVTLIITIRYEILYITYAKTVPVSAFPIELLPCVGRKMV